MKTYYLFLHFFPFHPSMPTFLPFRILGSYSLISCLSSSSFRDGPHDISSIHTSMSIGVAIVAVLYIVWISWVWLSFLYLEDTILQQTSGSSGPYNILSPSCATFPEH